MISAEMWKRMAAREFDAPSAKCGCRYLSPSEKRRIRELDAEGLSQLAIAERLGIRAATISLVLTAASRGAA